MNVPRDDCILSSVDESVEATIIDKLVKKEPIAGMTVESTSFLKIKYLTRAVIWNHALYG